MTEGPIHRNACTLTKVDWFRLVLVTLRAGAGLDSAGHNGSIALQRWRDE